MRRNGGCAGLCKKKKAQMKLNEWTEKGKKWTSRSSHGRGCPAWLFCVCCDTVSLPFFDCSGPWSGEPNLEIWRLRLFPLAGSG